MNTQVINNSKHYFGMYGVLSEPLSMHDFGHYLVLNTISSPFLQFEISGNDYVKIQSEIDSMDPPMDQYIYIDLETDYDNRVLGWELVVLPYELEYATQIMLASYNRINTLNLFRFIQSLRHKALQSFMWSVFSNLEIAKKFVSIPASKRHHHSYPGGLLDHSLECARMVKKSLQELQGMSSIEIDTSSIAALLHDVGKVKTLNSDGTHSLEGYVMNHEYYTLNVIQPELEQLKKAHKQAAIALEYLLTWKDSDGYPNFIGATLIKAADRASTASDLQRKAFAGKPNYHSFASFETGSSQVYLSRLQ